MTRGRSISVVQRIASEIPAYSQENLQDQSTEAKSIHNPTLPRRSTLSLTKPSDLHRSRSKSFDSSINLNHKNIQSEKFFPLFPFTDSEKEDLWLEYLDTLNYNSILDSTSINNISDFNDDLFLSFKTECDLNISYVDGIASENEQILNDLSVLMNQYETVSRETSEFASQATELLAQQDSLEQKSSQMSHVLRIFEPLESITKRLVSSGNSIIRMGKVVPIIHQLQECLDFLEKHKSYKDSEMFTVRYRQCLTRALTLVRNHLIENLKTRGNTAYEKIQKEDLSNMQWEIHLYSGFSADLTSETNQSNFPSLFAELMHRWSSHSEYKGLLTDVLSQFFKIRSSILEPYFKKFRPVDSDSSLVVYCQKNINWFKGSFTKEFSLFSAFFPLSDCEEYQTKFFIEEFTGFCRNMLDPIYDDVRNRILRETNIEELCQLTNLLMSVYENEDDDSVVTTEGLDYSELFQPMLNDAQSRLIFRVQNYIDNKLLKYKPTPEDLQLANRRQSTSRRQRSESSPDEYPGNMFPECYPPVGKALSILSNIYELVNSMVFDDLAHHIVHNCIFMLKNGAVPLALTHSGALEAEMFYLKNLILLKYQISNFDIQYIRTETSVDFTSGISELLQTLRAGEMSVRLNEQGGIFELVKRSVPKVINNMIDAHQEIELEMTNSVTNLVTQLTNSICAPILNDSEKTLLKDKAILITDKVLLRIPQAYKEIKRFIAEEEVVQFILGQMTKLILETYERFYSESEQKSHDGSIDVNDLNDVMEPEAFLNFLNETVSDACNIEEDEKITFDENLPEEIEENKS